MKRRNHPYRSFGLLLIGGLLTYGLSELLVALGPIAGYQLKELNPLSDFLDMTANQSRETLSIPLRTANDMTATELHSADSMDSKDVTTDTLTPLEPSSRPMDYSEGQNALRRPRAALREGRFRSVWIAFVGDSFIEGDILVASFCQTLQQRCGDKDVGYVSLTSTMARSRQSIRQRLEGAWR